MSRLWIVLVSMSLCAAPALAKPRSHAPAAAVAAPMAAPEAGQSYATASVPSPQVNAHYAWLEDFDTGRVLYNKNGEERMPTSSMSKMMTVYLVFDQLKQGHLHMEDKLPVSEKAWREGGAVSDSSTMFAKLGDNIPVEDLLRGVIIQSGNDATIVLAEGIAGSEDAFAERMNIKATELGMTESHFMNASGLPNPEHYSTCRDLAILARHIITDFPEYYHFFGEKEFTWNGKTQGNRNPLLYRNIGVDGLKTGHAEQAGYGLTASGVENGHRLITVMNGMASMQARADEPTTLIEWGWHEFRLYDLLKAGTMIDKVPVWEGEADTVDAMLPQDVKLSLTANERHSLKATIVYDSPVAAPVVQGQKIGVLRIDVPGSPAQEFPLTAASAVARKGAVARVFSALHYLISGHT